MRLLICSDESIVLPVETLLYWWRLIRTPVTHPHPTPPHPLSLSSWTSVICVSCGSPKATGLGDLHSLSILDKQGDSVVTQTTSRESRDASTKSKMLILLLASAKLSQVQNPSWEAPNNRGSFTFTSETPRRHVLLQTRRSECWGGVAAVNII